MTLKVTLSCRQGKQSFKVNSNSRSEIVGTFYFSFVQIGGEESLAATLEENPAENCAIDNDGSAEKRTQFCAEKASQHLSEANYE